MKKIDNACAGKVKYESLEKANESVKNLNKLGGTRLNSYRCPICNFIHLGHDGKGKKLKPMDSYKNRDIHYVHESKTHIVDLKTHPIQQSYLDAEDYYILTGKIKKS